jgi:hypothetical protein
MPESKAEAKDAAAEAESTEGLSRDARDSTYEKAPEDPDAGFPPPGPGVIQTLGTPKEAKD